MKNKQDLSWVQNLPEVGSAIVSEANGILANMAAAQREFERAKKLHQERILSLEKTIADLWTAEEIEAAKRSGQ